MMKQRWQLAVVAVAVLSFVLAGCGGGTSTGGTPGGSYGGGTVAPLSTPGSGSPSGTGGTGTMPVPSATP